MITSKWAAPGQILEQAKSIYDACGMKAAANPMSWQVVLFDDKKPAAAGALSYRGPGRAKLEAVAVLPEFTGQGFDDFLVKILLYKCESLNIRAVEADAAEFGRTFWQKQGFTPATPEAMSAQMIKEISYGTGENRPDQCACEKG